MKNKQTKANSPDSTPVRTNFPGLGVMILKYHMIAKIKQCADMPKEKQNQLRSQILFMVASFICGAIVR